MADLMAVIWVRMSTQYASSSNMRRTPLTCPSIRASRRSMLFPSCAFTLLVYPSGYQMDSVTTKNRTSVVLATDGGFFESHAWDPAHGYTLRVGPCKTELRILR